MNSEYEVTTHDEDYLVYLETTSDQTYLLQKIEYNTNMISHGISHIFFVSLVLLGGFAAWVILKRWFFGGV